METNKTHTLGPWIADIRSGCAAVYPASRFDDSNGIDPYQDRIIFFTSKGAVSDATGWTLPEEQAANARLIAAAPELLAALEYANHMLTNQERAECEFDVTPEQIKDDVLNKIRTAISKATKPC